MNHLYRERILVLLTLGWSLDHFWGWFVLAKYGLGISALASLVMLTSLFSLANPKFSKPAQYILAIAFFLGTLGPAESTETVAFLLALILGLISFRKPNPWAGTFLVAIIYLFAAFNKLVSDNWREGSIAEYYFPQIVKDFELIPFVVWGTITIEVCLSVMLAFRLKVSVFAVAIFHILIVAFVSTDLHHAFSLAVYGALMVFLASQGSWFRVRDFYAFFRGRR